MPFKPSTPQPLADRGPLRVLFVITSMPVGGAETLLVNLIAGLDRERFEPHLCCMKEPGPLGEELQAKIPVYHHQLAGKYDFAVLGRLTRLMKEQRIDAVVTVGAGDKMFWGRLAAWRAGVPVVLSALHSTGWPDGVGRLNRLLTPITDGFIGVASEHGRHLCENERFPASKVHVIPNGVDVDRFRPQPDAGAAIRQELGIPTDAPVCGIVAALRPEKNHLLFLRAAALVKHDLPAAHFVITGEGPEREKIEAALRGNPLENCVHMTGNRSDIPQMLAAFDLFALTSRNEANPVSILEAMATGLPVVSTRVGSVAETVDHGVTGYLAPAGHADELAARWFKVLSNLDEGKRMGQLGRQVVVDGWSLAAMVRGYEELITSVYQQKSAGGSRPLKTGSEPQPERAEVKTPSHG